MVSYVKCCPVHQFEIHTQGAKKQKKLIVYFEGDRQRVHPITLLLFLKGLTLFLFIFYQHFP